MAQNVFLPELLKHFSLCRPSLQEKRKYFHIKHKYFFFYPPPERVERPLELCLLELVFPVEDPDLLQRHGHGAQQQPVLAAREPQPWAAEF